MPETINIDKQDIERRANKIKRKQKKEDRDVGQENLQLLIEYNEHTARRNWIQQGDINENFYYGKQFDKEAQDILNDRGQIAVPINRTRPLIRHFVSLIMAQAPAFTAVGISGDDHKKSWLFKAQMAKILTDNHIVRSSRSTIFDMARRGLGNLFVYFNPHARNGKGSVEIRYMTNDEIVWDPNATPSLLFSDAENMIMTKVMSVAKAKQLFGEKHYDKIELRRGVYIDRFVEREETSESESETKIDIGVDYVLENVGSTEFIRIIERHKKEELDVWIVEDKNTGRTREYYIEKRKDKEIGRLKKQGLKDKDIIVINLKKERVVKHTSICDMYVDSEILPISEYPAIPFVNEDTKNPFPLGEIEFLRPLQEVVNKAEGISIYNAQIISNPGMLISKKKNPNLTSQNIETIRNTFSNPGAITAELDDITDEGVRIRSGGVPSPAFYTISDRMKFEMDNQISISPQERGQTENVPRTYKATLAIREWGLKNVSLAMQSITDAFTVLGKIVLDYIQAEYSVPDVIRLTTDMVDDLDLQQFMQEQQQQGLVETGGKNIYIKINQMVKDSQQVTRYLNDLSVGEYDIEIVPASFVYTDRTAISEQMVELKNSGIVDNIAVLKELDIKDKEEIIQRMDMVQQLTQALEQMSNGMSNVQAKQKSTESALARADRDNLEKDYEIKLVKQEAANAADMKIEIARLRDTIKALTKESSQAKQLKQLKQK